MGVIVFLITIVLAVDTTPSIQPSTVEPTVTPEIEQRTEIRPAEDRIVTLKTAGTLDKGTWMFTDVDIAMLMFAYGITDSFQLKITAGPAPFYFIIIGWIVGLADLKWRFMDTPRVKVSGNLFAGAGAGVEMIVAGSALAGMTGGGGFSMDVCFDKECRYMMTVAGDVGGGYLFSKYNEQALFFNTGVGFRIKANELVSVLLEGLYSGLLEIAGRNELFDIGSVSAGIRFYKEQWLVDIGAMFPTKRLWDIYCPLPVVSISYAW